MSIQLGIRVKGADEAAKALESLGTEYQARLGAGLLKAGLKLQREAQLRVPVDTGNLKASAETRLKRAGKKSSATVIFTANYALFVHERLDIAHQVGEAKYLENAYEENKDLLYRLIRMELER